MRERITYTNHFDLEYAIKILHGNDNHKKETVYNPLATQKVDNLTFGTIRKIDYGDT